MLLSDDCDGRFLQNIAIYIDDPTANFAPSHEIYAYVSSD